MAANATMPEALPPLPSYELQTVPSLIPGLDDFYVSLMAPILAYWVVSGIFHIIDVCDLYPQYRLHTPAEIASRNRATRYEVLRDVLLQQVIQMVVGAALSYFDPPELMGKEDYDVAVWATRVRLAQRALPAMLATLGINAASMAKNMSATHPLIAGALSGGYYPFLTTGLAGPDGASVPAFAAWEMVVAQAIYWVAVPALQFGLAVSFLDSWQYFLHRAMHMNKWLYSMSKPPTPTRRALVLMRIQLPFIRDTTAYTSPMPTAHSTTTHLRVSCSTRSARASVTSWPE